MNSHITSLGLRAILSTSALALTLGLTTAAQAQVTSSNINGSLVDASGNGIAGASVTIIHTPTGSANTATTSSNGAFFASGLRVGGPYTITAVSPNGNAQRSNIRLQPSSNSLRLEIEAVDEVIVTATRVTETDLNNGVGSAFSADEILSQPSATRDLIATLVRDPLANSTGEGILSVAGTNPRFNALAIDGSLQGDDFGLSSSTYATARAPISLDIIESASVVASDYSVTTSGFTGGLVNVVTKSGTNEIDGSLYFYKQNEDFFGDKAFEQDVTVAPFDEEEYGFVVSGPIIKDKLFFLASYDEFNSGSGREFTQADADDGINPALYTGLNQIVQDAYGFDLGGRPNTVSLPVTSERFFGKLDWNINENHRLSASYQDTQENGFAGTGQTTFQSAYYSTPQSVQAYNADLFSNWTDTFSTNLRVNYKDNTRGQNCNAGSDVGQFEIRLSEASLVGTEFEGFINEDPNTIENNNISFIGGCDRFRQGNTFSDDRLQIFGSANLIAGDHNITFGGEIQEYNLDNLFAQRSSGLFRFDSIANLEAGTANRVQVQLPDTGNREDIRAKWGFTTMALFAGDSWQIKPELSIDYGIRYERIVANDEPQVRSFFGDTYGFSNAQDLDGLDLIMPRLSFRYQPLDRTTVSGGFGLFGGGSPAVWVSNAFTPPVFFEQAFNVENVNPANGAPAELLADIQANDANGPGPIDVISPDFTTPSDWKASLRLDQEFDMNFGGFNLGEDYVLSLQALYSATNKGFRWENLAQTQLADALPLGVAPDGRPVYADLDALDISNAIALTNFDAGESLTLSASLAKDYENGLGFFLSYAYQDVETVTPGTSSRGVSNFRAIVDSDRNNPSAGTAPFQTEHAFKVALSYEDTFVKDYETKFSLFGQITSGDPFSYTFQTDRDRAVFGRSGDGESPFDNDLLYVPTISGGAIDDANVVVASGFDEQAFIDYVNDNGLATGGIIDRNSDKSTWNQRWDFQFEQEIPFFNKAASKFVGENRLKFIFNIDNVMNLINSDWGTQQSGPGFDAIDLVNADLVSVADVAANGVDDATALRGDAPRTTCTTQASCVYRFNRLDTDPISFQNRISSLYQLRVGIRYEF